MEHAESRPEAQIRWRGKRPRRPPLECRECGAICERLVSPWQCLRSECPYVYSYPDEETTYFGCLHKVFAPELDLAAFLDETGEVCRLADPYGPIRATRAPRGHCPVTIERVYESAKTGGCRNPAFFSGPSTHGGTGGTAARSSTRGPGAEPPDRRGR